MGMINGVWVESIADDALDYRCDNELWFWPNGYGKAPAYELSRQYVKEMLDGFDQEFASDSFFTSLKKRLVRLKEVWSRWVVGLFGFWLLFKRNVRWHAIHCSSSSSINDDWAFIKEIE